MIYLLEKKTDLKEFLKINLETQMGQEKPRSVKKNSRLGGRPGSWSLECMHLILYRPLLCLKKYIFSVFLVVKIALEMQLKQNFKKKKN